MQPKVKIHLLPGGKMPKRMTKESVGYDVCIRAVVSNKEMDPRNPRLRKTLFDFRAMPDDPDIRGHVISQKEKELVYRMDPDESVLVGIGFVLDMSYPLCCEIFPRSGLAGRWGISVTNAPGLIDPDYRGEAGVLVLNRNKHAFDLRLGMRIAQITFRRAIMPNLRVVKKYEDLSRTIRGVGGFGSTGLIGSSSLARHRPNVHTHRS